MAASASGARPRFVWTMTPVALITGWRDGRNERRSSASAIDSMRVITTAPVESVSSPAAMADRTAAAALRRAVTVASAPKRDSSAWIPGCCRRNSRDGSRRAAAIPRAVLVERCPPPPRPVSHRRQLGRDRGAHRRSSRSVCARALAAAGLAGDLRVMAVAAKSIDKDLQRLEAELKQLEAEYNMFFSGRLPRPPWETRGRVEALVKQYDRTYIANYGDRFRFTT